MSSISPTSTYGDAISEDLPISQCRIQIIRPAQALHNVIPNHAHRDPPLTKHGLSTATNIKPSAIPDLLILSLTTRAIQTALATFKGSMTASAPETPKITVQIWPEVREAQGSNDGLSKLEIEAKYPHFDCSRYPVPWDCAAQNTVERAEGVRRELKALAKSYRNITLVTHHRFLAFLVPGSRFEHCEARSYRFAEDHQIEGLRHAIHVDTLLVHDFGPTVLVRVATEL